MLPEQTSGATRVIVIRHGESTGNKTRIFQGQSDCDISGKGELQLALLALRMRNVPFTAIYSSPLLRARKTAEAVNRWHGLPICFDDRLKEIDGGVWEGMDIDSFALLRPEDERVWHERPWEFSPENGEKMTEVYARAVEAAEEIAKAHAGETVCIVSHGCVIRSLLCRAQYGDVKKLGCVDFCDNTSLSVLEYLHGVWSLKTENDASHLSGEAL